MIIGVRCGGVGTLHIVMAPYDDTYWTRLLADDDISWRLDIVIEMRDAVI